MLSFFRSASGASSKEEPLLSDTTSESGSSSYEHMRTDMQAPGVPTWMTDAEAPTCFSCDCEFTFTKRRHHCRRCRSIFCENCTLRRSKILLLAITEEARVCEDCNAELPFENSFIEIQKPVLQRGATFQKSGGCCLGAIPVTIQLDPDGRTLVVCEDKGKPIKISAADLDNVVNSSESTFLLVCGDLSINFICDSESTKLIWIDALKALVRVSREPSLHDKIMRIRRLKIESIRKNEEAERRNAAFVDQMNARKKEREAIRARSTEKKK
jgi:hypothetical protein